MAAESVCRVLRDGALEGELSPALLIKDTIHSPLGLRVFDYVISQLSSYILAGKSQSGVFPFQYDAAFDNLLRGVVVVAFSRSPAFYVDLLKNSGFDDVALNKWVRILDCFSDPLGWKHRLKESGKIGSCPESLDGVTVFRDVRNLDKLLSEILKLGKGLLGSGKDRFCIAIDSVSEVLRDVPLSSAAALLSDIRSHEQVSCTLWSLHCDVHNSSTNAALEYMCSIVATVEGVALQPGASLLEHNVRKAKLRVRLKRRNGRVRLMSEDIHVEQSGVSFLPISSEEESAAQSLVPKVHFNLQLSEKELIDRSNVVLPFEHHEKERAQEIYDGRRTPVEANDTVAEAEKLAPIENAGRGEIVYFRDSDDERPDSDEDPDDDLDI